MMMGITPFFREFSDMPVVEDLLANRPKALIGLLKVIGRARRAAGFARDWAVIRHDLDEQITLAALLRAASEILCWCFAPVLTEKVALQQATRDCAASSRNAGIRFLGPGHPGTLIKAWRMPALLAALMNEADAENPAYAPSRWRPHSRGTAPRLERPRPADDFEAIAALVHMGRSHCSGAWASRPRRPRHTSSSPDLQPTSLLPG